MRQWICSGCLLWSIACIGLAGEEAPNEKPGDLQAPAEYSEAKQSGREDSDSKQPRPVTLEQARRQADVLHVTIHSALRLVHDRYYKEDEGMPIPATVIRSVFSELEREQGVKLRWLAVEGLAMNTDHIAETKFERAAVTALKEKRDFLEEIEGTTFRRAVPITLANQCLKCHVPDRRTLEDRRAGLIIEIPLHRMTEQSDQTNEAAN